MRRFLFITGIGAAVAFFLRRRGAGGQDESFGYTELGTAGAVESPASGTAGAASTEAGSSAPEAPSAMTPPMAPPTEVSPVGEGSTADTAAYEPGVASGQEEREGESKATDETRYERVTERESEERETTAERLAEDPLTKRLDEPAP